jgi:hypothetical protein
MHTKFWLETRTRPLTRLRRRWKFNTTRMDLGEVGREGVDGMHIGNSGGLL